MVCHSFDLSQNGDSVGGFWLQKNIPEGSSCLKRIPVVVRTHGTKMETTAARCVLDLRPRMLPVASVTVASGLYTTTNHRTVNILFPSSLTRFVLSVAGKSSVTIRHKLPAWILPTFKQLIGYAIARNLTEFLQTTHLADPSWSI